MLSLTLACGSRAAAGEAESAVRPAPVDAPVRSSWLENRLGSASRVLWGMGEWPLPMLEAERRSFGMRLEFRFGGDQTRRRGRSVR